jgi:hypothetical protein
MICASTSRNRRASFERPSMASTMKSCEPLLTALRVVGDCASMSNISMRYLMRTKIHYTQHGRDKER